MRKRDPLDALRGSDRRSIGRANEVAGTAARDPALMAELASGLSADDAALRMRCADALEKASRGRPDLLAPVKPRLLALLGEARQQELRWHLAQIVPRLHLEPAEHRVVVARLRAFLRDPSRIVRACALEALALLLAPDPRRRPALLRLLRARAASGAPAVRARARRLLARFEIRKDGQARRRERR